MFFNIPFTAQEYKVLATDYDAWAIEYRCQDHGVTSRRESLWILTRQPSPPKTILDSAHEYLNLIHFKTKSLGKVNQSCHVNNGHDEEDAEQAFRRQWLRSEIRAPRKPVNQTIRRIPSVSLEASTFHHTRVPTKNLIQDEMQNHKSNRPLVSKVTSAMLPFKMMKRRTDKEKKRGKLQTYDHSKVYNMTAENLLLITLLGAFV
ncbi:hypothetical protein QYM36_000662 [Artemia franciscana]|nr:hypothetical protein QYM36_000662 [Artemia franciscana]